MKLCTLIACIEMLFAASAFAAQLPVHDVESLCRRSVPREGWSQCIRARQFEYDMIKFYWPKLTETEQSNLLKQAYMVAEDTRGPFPNDDAHKAVIYGYMLPFIRVILEKRETHFKP